MISFSKVWIGVTYCCGVGLGRFVERFYHRAATSDVPRATDAHVMSEFP